MEIRPVPKREFLPEFDRHEPVVLDSTSITTFMECPRKYFYRFVLGFNDRQSPIYFTFGGAYHVFWDVLVKKAKELASKDLFENAAEAAFKYYTKRTGSGDVTLGGRFDFLTIERLLLSCKVAFDYYERERALKQIEIVASEQVLVATLPNGETTGGRSDQMVRWSGRLWGRDHKTTSKKFEYFKKGLEPNDQFMRYTYMESKAYGEQVMGQIVLALHNSKAAGPELQAFLSTRSVWQQERWVQDQMQVLKVMDSCRESDVWPQSPKNCGWCSFQNVCCATNETGVADKLKSMFTQKPWDFTAVEVEGE